MIHGKQTSKTICYSSTTKLHEPICNLQIMTQHLIDTDLLQNASFLGKSLSDGNRLRILLLISEGKKSVSAIVEALNLSQPLVSHHLRELKHSLLVKVHREGPFIYYELSDPRILKVVRALSEIATDLLSEKKNF